MKAGDKAEVRYWDSVISEKNPTANEVMDDARTCLPNR